MENKKDDAHKKKEREGGPGREGWGSIASIFAVAGAGLHEDIIGTSPHGAEVLIACPFSGWTKESTAADEAPVTIHCNKRMKLDFLPAIKCDKMS